MVTGQADINLFRLLALRGALHLETLGIRTTRRPVGAAVRQAIGSSVKSKAKLLKALEDYIEAERGPLAKRYT